MVFASPNTLHALLATVSMFHIESKIGEQAILIQQEVGGLTRDVELLAERIEKLATHFRQVGEDINGAQTSVKRIVQKGERIANVDLGEGDAPRPALKYGQARNSGYVKGGQHGFEEPVHHRCGSEPCTIARALFRSWLYCQR